MTSIVSKIVTKREKEQIGRINKMEFWAVYDAQGYRVGNKKGTRNMAIRVFILNRPPFIWNDFQERGYIVKKISVVS